MAGIDHDNLTVSFTPARYSTGSDEEDGINGIMDGSVDERSRLLDEADGLLQHSHETKITMGSNRSPSTYTYEDALKACEFGKFHLILLLLCGWAVSSDAIEVLSISFILPSATCDLGLTSTDKGVLNSIVFLGMLVGGYFWGSLADRWGRRNILVWSLLVNAVGNLSSSAAQTFGLFLACRMVSGIGVGGSMPVIFTYFTEFQHKEKRGAMISLLATFWMGGNIIAAGLAWAVIPREYLSFSSSDFIYHSWRVFVALCSLPALTSAAMFVLMPESPKFYLQKGNEMDAMSVLQRVHSSNKSRIPLQMEHLVLSDDVPNTSSNLDPVGPKQRTGCCPPVCKKMLNSTLELFSPQLRRSTLALLVINFTLAFGYYGLFLWFPELFQRMDKYGGSFCDAKTGNSSDSNTCEPPSNEVFLDSFLTGISNLPGNMITFFLVERIGRKALLASSMTLSGLSVFLLFFISKKWESVFMSCLFGAISVCGFNMLDVLQVELFPTGVRSTAFGVQTVSARVGAILGNIAFGALVDFQCAIPMLLVASLLTFGGMMALMLPNTRAIDIH